MKRFSRKIYIAPFIVAGFLIRLIFFTIPGFRVDVTAWYAWALRLYEGGFANFYSPNVWTNYTPGYLYLLFILAALKTTFNLNSDNFYLLLKLPAIIAEVFLGLLIFWEGKRITNQKTLPFIGSLFILFNPAFIFNSSVWGQIDGILAICMFLSIYFLKYKMLYYSSLFLGFSFLVKPQTVAIFPIFFLYLIKNFSFKNVAQLVLPGLGLVFLLFLPFFPHNEIFKSFTLIQSMIGDYPYTSLFAYNLWGMVGFWKSDTNYFYFFNYQTIGALLFIIYWIVLGFLYFRKKISLYSLAALSCLAFYFLPTRVHDRYLYPALVFLVLSALELRSKILFFLIGFLSLTHLLNLYYVYVYYNELFEKTSTKVLYSAWLYPFLDNQGQILSLISTTIFVLITFIIIKSAYAKKNI